MQCAVVAIPFATSPSLCSKLVLFKKTWENLNALISPDMGLQICGWLDFEVHESLVLLWELEALKLWQSIYLQPLKVQGCVVPHLKGKFWKKKNWKRLDLLAKIGQHRTGFDKTAQNYTDWTESDMTNRIWHNCTDFDRTEWFWTDLDSIRQDCKQLDRIWLK